MISHKILDSWLFPKKRKMTPAHPRLMFPYGHFCSELRSGCLLQINLCASYHSLSLPAPACFTHVLIYPTWLLLPLSLQPVGDGLRLSFEGPGMPCQDFTFYPESNQESWKVIIKQRLTGSDVYKRQGGWERDGGNVVIIRHEGTNGFSQGIPFRLEQQLFQKGH